MKKFLIGLGIFFTLVGSSLAFYTDVPEDHQYYDSIKALYDLGRLPLSSSDFRPDDSLTEADLYDLMQSYLRIEDIGFNLDMVSETKLVKHRVLTILFALLDVEVDGFFDKRDFPFKDLDVNSRIAPVASKAAEVGILELADPSYFMMAKRVVRGEAADYLYKIYQYEPGVVDENYVEEIVEELNVDDLEAVLLQHESFETFLDVWQTLNTDFLGKDGLDTRDLINGAIQGMVERAGDKYTTFHEEEDVAQFLSLLDSSYEGVGMSVDILDGDIVIVSPFKDSPAEKAGLLPGDVIVEIDGEDVRGWDLDEVVAKILGPINSAVEIKVLRAGVELEYSVLRDFVIFKTVDYELLERDGKKIAYIGVVSFSNNTFALFSDIVDLALQEGAEAVIVDMRSNPGGFMDVAVKMISVFSSDLKIAVSLKFSNGAEKHYYTTADGRLEGMETVVLVNQGSASASEIFAGAMQDYGWAEIIGVDTFGKATVQQIREYNSGALFRFTISNWLTPFGRNLDENGLQPDRVLHKAEDSDNQLEAAIQAILN